MGDDALLREIVRAFNEARPNEAIALAEEALRRDQANVIALFLSGVILSDQGRHDEAEPRLRRAIAIDPRHPGIRVALAQALRALGRAEEARLIATDGLRWAAGHPELRLERAVANAALGHLDASIQELEAILSHTPGWPDAVLPIADLLARRGAFGQALHFLDDARKMIDGGSDSTVRGAIELETAICLKRQRRHDEALQAFDRAKKDLPDNEKLLMEEASTFQHLRRIDDAIASYQALLSSAPLNLNAHLHLNELLYRHGRDDELFGSFAKAQAILPTEGPISAAWGQALLKVERHSDAKVAFQRALTLAPDQADALIGLARATEHLGDTDAAAALYAAAAASHPDDGAVLRAIAAFALRGGNAAAALPVARRAAEIDPANQEAIALLGLALRRLEDPEEVMLNDYGRFIGIYDLAPPPGWSSMTAFNEELGAYLDTLHDDRRENFTQTLRGGTRVYDEVFHNGHALIDALRIRIEEAIVDYVATLPDDAKHPFTSRRSSGFTYSGSWSSRMTAGGYHQNHVHPFGWISSAYYVTLPAESGDTAARPGWLAFGQPTPDLGNDPPRRLVQPLVGRLVLFPSYLWHGTTPFTSPETRATIAFDILPSH